MKGELKNFSKKFEKSFFKNKDGFFELPYLANSPTAMVESFDSMPFSKHFKKEKVFLPDNPFFKGHFYYRELEKGLWIFLSDLRYKKNISFKTIFDDNIKYDHFMLYFHLSPIESKNKHQLINGLSLSNCSWSLCKPGTSLAAFHFKDSRSMNITIHFNEEWLKKSVFRNSKLKGNKFSIFLKTEINHIIWSDVHDGKQVIFNEFYELLRDKKTEKNNLRLIKNTEELFAQFIHRYNTEITDADYFELSVENRQKIQQAEKIMSDNLFKEFPGIEKTAKETGLSPTKLKKDFKTVYKQSLFQYYRNKQLAFAQELLTNKKGRIKDIATIFGYENAAKFSAAFKKRFGYLPSEVTPIKSS
ncbi:MAG: AraC family transcriptional regulator [Bacteroidota bacterium]